MNIPIFKVKKEAGFRINFVDMLFITLLIFASYYLHTELGNQENLYLLPLYVGFTFFLFCNVFRLRTKEELIWTLFFLVSSFMSFSFFHESWVLLTFFLSSLLQVVLIGLAISSDGYRGIFANPKREQDEAKAICS